MDHRGKISPFLAIPLKHRELRVKVEGSQVIVSAFIDSKLTSIMSFSELMLPTLPQGIQEAQQGAAKQPATAGESK